MIQFVIFDLDNCLAPAHEVGVELYEPALEAIRRANAGCLSEDALEEAFAESWRHPLDWIADRYGFSPRMRDAAWQAFGQLEVKHAMQGYGDLACLSDFSMPCDLVTSGFRRLQESKIRALGIDAWFRHIRIDAVDEPPRHGKRGWFETLMKLHGCEPQDVLVVGDNPESELAAGRALGMKTVQTLRPGVPYSEVADAHVKDLHELLVWIKGL